MPLCSGATLCIPEGGANEYADFAAMVGRLWYNTGS